MREPPFKRKNAIIIIIIIAIINRISHYTLDINVNIYMKRYSMI
jgi:hypothetical protein